MRNTKQEREDLQRKFSLIPEDAQWYVELIGHDAETIERAVRVHEHVCLTCPPAPDRALYEGGLFDENNVCIDPEAGMDAYLKTFVSTYCDFETMDCGGSTAIN